MFEVFEDEDSGRLGGDEPVPFGVERAAGLLRLDQTADAVADEDADPGALDFVHLEFSVLDRLLGGGDSELAESGHTSRVATVHVLLGIEVLDLAGDVDGIRGVVERREDADAGLTGEAARPELLDGIADRRDSPHAGDDDARPVPAVLTVPAVAGGHSHLRTQSPAYALSPSKCARASAATKSEPATHINVNPASEVAASALSTPLGTLSTSSLSTFRRPNASTIR